MASISFIHNATLIYVSRSGYRILCDPWYTPGAFFTWIHVYSPGNPPKYKNDFDAIYLSHAHEDHFDEDFMRLVDRRATVIIPKEPLIPIMRNKLSAMGFKNMVVAENGKPTKLGDVEVTVFGPYQRSRFDDKGSFPNILDSSILFDDGDSKFLNTNDNFPTKSALTELTLSKGRVDCISILYNSAGFYPHCVSNLTDAEKAIESDRVIKRCVELVATLNLEEHCNYIFPIAGDFRLQGPSSDLNRFIPVSSPTEFQESLKELSGVRAVCPGGLGSFDLKTGKIIKSGIFYDTRDIRGHADKSPTMRLLSTLAKIKQDTPIDSELLIERFNSRLEKYGASSPYNFTVIDRQSEVPLFTYDNGSIHQVRITVDRLIFIGLITRVIHWQNAWLGGLMSFWRSDHPDYNKDFYDLLSFLHY